MIKKLSNFNLIFGTILLLTTIVSVRQHSFGGLWLIGFLLTLWYNWITLKRMEGQVNNFKKLERVAKLTTFLFAGLLIVGAVAKINIGLNTATNIRVVAFMVTLDLIFALTVILQTITTIKVRD